jgi:hypothetical protein
MRPGFIAVYTIQNARGTAFFFEAPSRFPYARLRDFRAARRR